MRSNKETFSEITKYKQKKVSNGSLRTETTKEDKLRKNKCKKNEGRKQNIRKKTKNKL